MNVEELLKRAAEAALAAAAKGTAKAEKKAEIKAERDLNSPAVKRAAAHEKAQALLDAARQKEVKQGLDLMEEFCRDISPTIISMQERVDGDRLLNCGLRIVVNFTKVDGANSPSIAILGGSGKAKNDRIIPPASLAKWVENDKMFFDRYKALGGSVTVSSRHEMYLELLRQEKEIARLQALLKRTAQEMKDTADAAMPSGALPVKTAPTPVISAPSDPQPGPTTIPDIIEPAQPVAGPTTIPDIIEPAQPVAATVEVAIAQ